MTAVTIWTLNLFYDDEISFLEHLPRILFSCEQQTKGEKICWYGVVKVIVNKSWSELCQNVSATPITVMGRRQWGAGNGEPAMFTS